MTMYTTMHLWLLCSCKSSEQSDASCLLLSNVSYMGTSPVACNVRTQRTAGVLPCISMAGALPCHNKFQRPRTAGCFLSGSHCKISASSTGFHQHVSRSLPCKVHRILYSVFWWTSRCRMISDKQGCGQYTVDKLTTHYYFSGYLI